MSVPGSSSDSSTIVVAPPSNIANVPYVGQMFESDELAYEFYNAYARQCAFGVRKGYWHKHKLSGRILDRKYYCDKEGIKKQDPQNLCVKKPRQNTRCGCGAEMGISLDNESGKYVVKTFVAVHNHLLQPLDCAHMIRSHRKFDKSQAFSAENVIKSGLSLKETFEYMGNEVGGVENLGFMKDDLKRHLQTKRQRSMEYGEAGVLLDYFQKQRALNPSFYSAYLLDEEQQITNIFWADPSMILDYASFGDVLAFDTTYKTNNCHRPCAVFAGFSNNRKTLIFGGALLYDETSASFAWIFKEYL